MAEFVMKDTVAKAGVSDRFYIESAATSTEEIGNHIYPPAQRKLREKGVAFDTSKTARQLRASDYDKFDHIVCMDRYNYRNIMRMLGEDPLGKVSMMMWWPMEGASASAADNASQAPKTGPDVADPWYTGDFEETYRDVLAGCQAMLKKVTPKSR
ncbi:MAG: low molecular weight phosphotyrosine protein phosphatase [Bacteroidales bacterium]|nr:low molecular weight phosphotyrosine protein phosphatase [Bacteroidales bacterium]